jgi:hypothetical protein
MKKYIVTFGMVVGLLLVVPQMGMAQAPFAHSSSVEKVVVPQVDVEDAKQAEPQSSAQEQSSGSANGAEQIAVRPSRIVEFLKSAIGVVIDVMIDIFRILRLGQYLN